MLGTVSHESFPDIFGSFASEGPSTGAAPGRAHRRPAPGARVLLDRARRQVQRGDIDRGAWLLAGEAVLIAEGVAPPAAA